MVRDLRWTSLLLVTLLEISSGRRLVAGTQSPAPFRFSAAGLGEVFVEHLILERSQDRLASVTFRRADRRELLKLRFLQFGPGRIAIRSYSVDGFPAPTIAVASSYARADGVTADLVAVGAVDGALQKLFAIANRDAGDGVCLAPPGRAQPATVIISRFIEGDYCVMCWPKRFSVTVHAWDDGRLRHQTTRRTSRLHDDWASAIEEFGLSCGTEILQSSLPFGR